MKKVLFVAFIAGSMLTSCSKKSSDMPAKPSTPTVLLTKIVENTAGSNYVGKPLAEFTYTGKQLTKAVLSSYSLNGSLFDVETDLFNYDGQGHLTGATISHTHANTYDYVSSTVTYSGDNISEIKLYHAGNILDRDYKLSYKDGKLVNTFNSNEGSSTYEYDSNGHNTKQTYVEYVSGQPDGTQFAVTNTSFDDKANLSQTLPNWIYFVLYKADPIFTFTPGTNNPVNSNNTGTKFTYDHQYNDGGYPTTLSWNEFYPQSYQYEYTTVN